MSSIGPSTTRPFIAERTTLAVRFADYLELTKPRIAVMALVTVTLGFTLGGHGISNAALLLHSLLGIGLVAAASSALNQWQERDTDALMHRTADRPLPSGRLLSGEVLLFGLATGIAGVAWLVLWVNLLTAGLSLLTLLLYTAVYTPLKRYTSFCTAIGAIPGALPPVLGWTAATGRLDLGALALFSILFLWQFPHFLAIAWLYRDDYRRGGLKMLPAAAEKHPAARITGILAVTYATALIPVSLLPRVWELAGPRYAAAALALGLGYFVVSLLFARRETPQSARRVLYYSLIYLPLLLTLLTWEHLRLMQ